MKESSAAEGTLTEASSTSSEHQERTPGRCWLCGSIRLALVKSSNVASRLRPEAFKITDAHYGVTLAIYRCQACDFLQCSGAGDPVEFYAEMSDEGYEDTRSARLRQARSVVEGVKPSKPGGAWLDVGAGSGTLVEAAKEAGYAAVGVEPSDWLAARGRERGLDVRTGVMPHPDIQEKFDVVSLIDVVEHVTNPVTLLKTLAAALKPDGVACVVTPDVESIPARLLGWRWWHFRVAHVGYFSLKTLNLALEASGLRSRRVIRPTWYLPADYLAERALKYAPRAIAPPVPKFIGRFTVPVNLHDSLMVFASKSPAD